MPRGRARTPLRRPPVAPLVATQAGLTILAHRWYPSHRSFVGTFRQTLLSGVPALRPCRRTWRTGCQASLPRRPRRRDGKARHRGGGDAQGRARPPQNQRRRSRTSSAARRHSPRPRACRRARARRVMSPPSAHLLTRVSLAKLLFLQVSPGRLVAPALLVSEPSLDAAHAAATPCSRRTASTIALRLFALRPRACVDEDVVLVDETARQRLSACGELGRASPASVRPKARSAAQSPQPARRSGCECASRPRATAGPASARAWTGWRLHAREERYRDGEKRSATPRTRMRVSVKADAHRCNPKRLCDSRTRCAAVPSRRNGSRAPLRPTGRLGTRRPVADQPSAR